MASYLFSRPSSSYAQSSDPSVPSPSLKYSLTTLPDELLSICCTSLTAKDLVSLEQVSHRMRDHVSGDDPAWKECAKAAWGSTNNFELMTMAAEIAGGWKQLYAEKKVTETRNSPWKMPSIHEIHAILELIKGPYANNTCSAKSNLPGSLSASPRSIMDDVRGHRDSLGVILLVDGSSSVTEDDFNSMKQFCTQLINNLRKTHSDSSVAVLQFNQYPKVYAGLTHVDEACLLDAVNSMSQMMGSTDIAAPIRRARQMLTEDGNEFAESAIVILTDGQTHSVELREAEKEARQAAIDSRTRLFAMGVGRDVDEIGLRRVACGTSDFLSSPPSHKMSDGYYFALRKMYR